MTTQTPATAEIEKWPPIQVRFFPNFWVRVQNPTGVDSGNPDPAPLLNLIDRAVWQFTVTALGRIA